MKDWDPRLYREQTGFVSELGSPLLDLLEPRHGEKVLDIGCGDGALTAMLVEAGCEVVGIDASPDMVEAARRRGLAASVLDARHLPAESALHEAFDAVFSNAALHWIRPMDAVVQGVHRVLKEAGRFVAEFGGEGNITAIRAALHGCLADLGIPPDNVDPWVFPSPEQYEDLLTRHGFEVKRMEHFARPTRLPGSITGWVESTGRPFLKAVPAAHRPEFLAAVEARLAPELRDAEGVWWADYVRLRLSAVKACPA